MNYSIRVISFLFVSIYVQAVLAQPNPPKNWRVGSFGEIDFTGTVGVPMLSQDTIGTTFSNTTIWNNSGDMLMYSNGFNVYDFNLNLMSGSPLIYDSTSLGFPTNYGSSLPYGSIILPRPGYVNQFYIFHTSLHVPTAAPSLFISELYYSIIDLSLNNGLGAITSVKDVMLDDTTWIGYLSAVRHGNGRDWWLVSGRNYSNFINTWLVQPDTIIGPFSQPVGLSLTWSDALNQIQFSPDGNKLAVAYAEHSGQLKKFLLADFNRCIGQVSNPNIIQFSDNDQVGWGVTGIEFSASNRFVYASSGSYLYQFDLLSTNIQNSKLLVKTHDHVFAPFQSGFYYFKRGPDNRIYMANGAGNYVIDIINYPDSLGIACDVQLRQIDYNAQFGDAFSIGISVLPNYPSYELGPLVGSPCDTLTGVAEIHSGDSGISIYPNPTAGSISIQLPSGASGKVSIELLDLLGRKVYVQEINNQSTTQIISLPVDIVNGVYVCRVVTDVKVYSEKLVMER